MSPQVSHSPTARRSLPMSFLFSPDALQSLSYLPSVSSASCDLKSPSAVLLQPHAPSASPRSLRVNCSETSLADSDTLRSVTQVDKDDSECALDFQDGEPIPYRMYRRRWIGVVAIVRVIRPP